MTSALVSIAADLARQSGAAELATHLSEPSAPTVVAVAIAGIVVGRFLLGRGHD